MLSIVSITPPIAVSAVPPCLIATIRVSSKFGALRERFYIRRIWLQILKTLREEKNAVRELRRCDERVHMFQCLVIYMSLDKIYYVHAQARYILLSHCSQPRFSGHVCGAEAGRTERFVHVFIKNTRCSWTSGMGNERTEFFLLHIAKGRPQKPHFQPRKALEQSIRSPSDHFHLLSVLPICNKTCNIFGERCLIGRAKCR